MAARRNTIIIAIVLVALIVVARLLPHAANFTPVAAVALFAGVYLKKSYAFLLPFAGMVLSDLFLTSYPIHGRLVVYGSFLLVGLIGWAVAKRKSIARIIGGSLASSLAFFLITNCVFLYSPVMYSHDIAGQIASYVNAIPFFRNAILGDLFYVSILFGGYELVKLITKHRRQALAKV